MGSAPCNLFCCTKPSISLPKSDLYVPQINIDIIQNTKNIETNIITNYVDKPKQITTEKYIQEKHRIKNSLTDENRNKKIKINLTFGSLNDSNKKKSYKNDKTVVLNSVDNSNGKEKGKIKDIKMIKKEKKNKKNIGQNTDIICQEKNKNEIMEHLLTKKEEFNIMDILYENNLFKNIDQNLLIEAIRAIKEIELKKNTVIFNEGDKGSNVFIILTGSVSIFSQNSENEILLNQGNIFGELALIKNNVIRNYTAIAFSDILIYKLDKNFFMKIKKSEKNIKNKFNFELFNYISEPQKENLEYLVNTIGYKKGEKIKNIKGLFWIQKGTISIYDSSRKEKDVYRKGEFFGSLKYKYNCVNNNDDENNKERKKEKNFYSTSFINKNKNNNIEIIAKEDLICNVISDISLIEVFGIEYKYNILKPFFYKCLLGNKYFKNIFINNNNIKEIINLFHLKEYKNNDMLSSSLPDDIPKKIIIIIEGQACIYNDVGQEKNIITSGQIVGEDLILGEEQKNVIVESNHLISLECDWDILKKNINVMDHGLNEWIDDLNSIYFFRGLPVYKLVEIIKNIKIEKFKEGEKVIKKSEKVEYVYFINKGTLLFELESEIFQEYHSGNSFGEIFIFNGKPAFGEISVAIKNNKKNKNDKNNNNECILYKISKNYFFELLSDRILNNKTKIKLCLEDSEIFPKSLYYIATLHKGSTSNIYLVHNKIYVYVMKAIYIKKYYEASAFEGKAVRNVLNEKDASKLLDNPFLIKYVKTLKNQNWCFFIAEFINGILLSEYIRMFKPFNNIEVTRFYSACFMIMLQALKEIGLIHRDIRQNNIIIEKSGYPRLIDFSCCKKILGEKTSTLIGTPFFMAPEVLKGKKYDYSCDYWSTGVLVYYLFYGEYPFGNNMSQPVNIYKEIINKELEFRDDLKFDDSNKDKYNTYENEVNLRKFLCGMLEKDEKKRISDLNTVKNLEFFKNIDFDKIKRQEIKSPFIPEVVKFNYQKELNNCSKPFENFIEGEKVEILENASNKKKNISNKENNYEKEKNENNYKYQANLMKLFEKF